MFRNIVARDVGWSIIDTDFRYRRVDTGIFYNEVLHILNSSRQLFQGQQHGRNGSMFCKTFVFDLAVASVNTPNW